MYTLEPRFKTRVMAGMFGAITLIYFYNNPDNFDAIKVRVKSGISYSYNMLSGIFNINLYSNRLIMAPTQKVVEKMRMMKKLNREYIVMTVFYFS